MFPIIDKKRTGINLKRIMVQRGISVKDIQKFLHLGSVQSVYYWLNGVSLPSVDNLYALSQLFQVPIDDLICGNREMLSIDVKDSRNQRIHMYCTKLNEICAA